MELTDGVVTLRTPVPDDAEAVAGAVQESLDHLHDFMQWATPDYDVAAAREWIDGEVDPGAHPFLVFDAQHRLLGSAGISRIDRVNDCGDVGYWLRPDATGQGYATRAVKLLLDYAIEQVGLHRVEIYMSVDNAPSRAVVERTRSAGTCGRLQTAFRRPHSVWRRRRESSIARNRLPGSGQSAVDRWRTPEWCPRGDEAVSQKRNR